MDFSVLPMARNTGMQSNTFIIYIVADSDWQPRDSDGRVRHEACTPGEACINDCAPCTYVASFLLTLRVCLFNRRVENPSIRMDSWYIASGS